jgi:hypothetical protein
MALKELRTRKVLVSFTESEWALIGKAVSGVPLAIWIRIAAVEKARKSQEQI